MRVEIRWKDDNDMPMVEVMRENSERYWELIDELEFNAIEYTIEDIM